MYYKRFGMTPIYHRCKNKIIVGIHKRAYHKF